MTFSWRHTGFHVHNEDKVVANDMEGRERLARYLIRPPVSLERLTYDRENQQVSYQGKTQTYIYQPLDFLAADCPERSEGSVSTSLIRVSRS